MNLLLLRYFPLAVLLLPVLFAWLKCGWPLARRTSVILVIALLYWTLAPFLFPNDGGKQWGPRFFLPLIPATLLACAGAWRQWTGSLPPRYRLALQAIVFPLICYGFFLNTVQGASILREDDLNRIRPALEYVRNDPGNIVVVNAHFIAMELSSVFREKYFFLVDDTTGLHKLIPILEHRGADHFVYVSSGRDNPAGFDELFLSHHTKLMNKGGYMVGSVALEK